MATSSRCTIPAEAIMRVIVSREAIGCTPVLVAELYLRATAGEVHGLLLCSPGPQVLHDVCVERRGDDF